MIQISNNPVFAKMLIMLLKTDVVHGEGHVVFHHLVRDVDQILATSLDELLLKHLG